LIPSRGNNGIFSLPHRVQTSYGAHSTSYPVVTGGSFPGIMWPGREADHFRPSNAEVKNAWSYTFTPPYLFMAWCLVKYRGNFTLPLQAQL